MIQDSLTVIAEHGRLIFGILLLIVFGQLALSRVLRFIFGEQLTADEVLALGLTGWLVPASLLALLWRIFGLIPALTVLILLTVALFRFTPRPDPAPDSTKITFSLLTFLLISILLRLTFVSQAILPSYFDSAQHYLFIKDILQGGAAPINYYHLGFHTLAAFIVSVTRADIAETMLILGQVILAVMPVGLFLPVKHATRSTLAGLFAVILAAFGWYMPAHAVNWGKYPALMSLGLLPFVLSLAYLLARYNAELRTRQRRGLWVLFGISVLVSILAHTRTVAVFAVIFIAWNVVQRWMRFSVVRTDIPQAQDQPGYHPTPRESFSVGNMYAAGLFLLAVLALGVFIISRQPLFAPLLDAYLKRGLWITALVLLLSLFAWRASPQWTLTALLSIALLLVSLFIPVRLPSYGDLTLLDRPYVQMFLFLPLSVLGGLGLAGMGKIFRARGELPTQWITLIASVALGGLVIIHALMAYDYYPSNCCVLASEDDLLALTWLDEKLPLEARVGVAGAIMQVFTAQTSAGLAGSDAGIWVTPLTGRVTVVLPNLSDFSQPEAYDQLCRMQVTHLYIGGIGQPFGAAQINAGPERYRLLFARSEAKVYEVVGCGE